MGADESGDLLYDEVDYRGPTGIVIGGEGEGIRRLVLEGCDQVVRLPMEGQVSSLNAAAAGTVMLYEALRQRRRDVAPAQTRTPRPEPVAESPEDGASESDEPVEAIAAEAGTAEDIALEAPAEVANPPEPEEQAPVEEKPKKTPRKRATKKAAE